LALLLDRYFVLRLAALMPLSFRILAAMASHWKFL
jgi:hypothetical protein